MSFAQKAFCGLTAGFFGAIIGNPADLALIRVQADTTLPPAERRNYKNVADAFIRIVKEEGVGALWKGCTPTVARAVALNFGNSQRIIIGNKIFFLKKNKIKIYLRYARPIR